MSEFTWIDPEARPEQVLATLGEPGAPLSLDEQAARADRFLAGLAMLSLQRLGAPPDPEFLADSATRLPASWVGVLHFRSALLDLLQKTFVVGEWKECCERRTALQVLVDWYGERPELPLGELELERVDELLRLRGDTEGFLLEEEIPEGIPPTHWWWRLPDRG